MNSDTRTGHRGPALAFSLLLVLLASGSALADEGMWTLDDFPAQAVKDRHGVTIGNDWLYRVQRSTVRLDGGCTGSFASPDGLVLTNNHCVWGCVRNLSTNEKNLSNEGFLATTTEQELQCPGMRLSVMHASEDITGKVREETAGMDEVAANQARKALLSRLESECEASGDLSCETVNLYHGGQFFLYKHKRYEDVRLVFSPELAIAAFGGDPDNFNFPRFNLDMSFLRAYEDGKPASTPNYFPWRADGAAEGEAVFVSGHPGSTDRLLTVSELDHTRRYSLPFRLELYAEYRGRLLEWGQTGEDAARQVQQRRLNVENALKVWRNQLRSLMDPVQMKRKIDAENALKAAVMADPKLQDAYGNAWHEASRAIANYQQFYERYQLVENQWGVQGMLYYLAHTLVRATAEMEKPNEERLRAYSDSALPRVEQRMLADAPVHKGREQLKLTFSLDKLLERLGPDDPVIHAVIGKESPRALATRLVEGTQLHDAAFRKALWQGGAAAVQASDDPMIEFARRVEPFARELLEQYMEQVEAPLSQASEQIARARFAVLGKDVYPDATFTLRVTYGAVQGWNEKGRDITPFTQMGRVFERETGQDPFVVPPSWHQAIDRLALDTRYNFVSTTDIIGGNSGSPVINAQGELVGLAFDGNIHSIAGGYWFDESLNRTVSVHVAAMLEALKTIYGAENLVDELSVTR
jgi:hypothetical protein